MKKSFQGLENDVPQNHGPSQDSMRQNPLEIQMKGFGKTA